MHKINCCSHWYACGCALNEVDLSEIKLKLLPKEVLFMAFSVGGVHESTTVRIICMSHYGAVKVGRKSSWQTSIIRRKQAVLLRLGGKIAGSHLS